MTNGIHRQERAGLDKSWSPHHLLPRTACCPAPPDSNVRLPGEGQEESQRSDGGLTQEGHKTAGQQGWQCQQLL